MSILCVNLLACTLGMYHIYIPFYVCIFVCENSFVCVYVHVFVRVYHSLWCEVCVCDWQWCLLGVTARQSAPIPRLALHHYISPLSHFTSLHLQLCIYLTLHSTGQICLSWLNFLSLYCPQSVLSPLAIPRSQPNPSPSFLVTMGVLQFSLQRTAERADSHYGTTVVG